MIVNVLYPKVIHDKANSVKNEIHEQKIHKQPNDMTQFMKMHKTLTSICIAKDQILEDILHKFPLP